MFSSWSNPVVLSDRLRPMVFQNKMNIGDRVWLTRGALNAAPGRENTETLQKSAEAHLQVLMAGRAATSLTVNDVGSGCGDDLRQATGLAQNMCQRWGMSEKIGTVAYSDINLIGNAELKADIDDEVRRLVENAEDQAKGILDEHRDHLMRLTAKLMNQFTMTRSEIDAIMGET